MNISQAAFRYRPTVLLFALGMMIFGAASYFTLPAREDPEITIREALITSAYPGLPAEDVERLITKPLEEAAITIPEVDEVRSTSLDGFSVVHVKAEDKYFDLDQPWDELEEAIQEAGARLPAGADRPHVNDDFGDVAVITLALSGEGYALSELFDFAQHVRDQLIPAQGVRKIDILGAKQERIFVETENARLSEAGVPPDAIADALRRQNTLRPGGAIDIGDRAFVLVPTGAFESVDDVRRTLIRSPEDGALFELGDLATVTKGYEDPARQAAFYNGAPAIVLAISMQPEESVLNFSARMKGAIDDAAAALPVGLDLDIVTFQADQVEKAVYGVSASVAQTLAIVLGVVILFLGLRTGLIVGAIVPGVMLTTLAIMGVFGLHLERMSLATLVIALGLLVDNGIVIAEDFKRRLEEFGDRDRALKETGGELALPLLSSSLTTILVFLPLMLAQHSAGEYTRNISLLILISLLTSWVLAMTVTPTLCHLFIKSPSTDGARQSGARKSRARWDFFAPVERGYEKALRWMLRFRMSFMVVMITLFAISASLMQTVPQRFFPESDRSQILVYVNLPADVTTRATEAALKDMMAIVSDRARYPDLESVAAYSGFGGPRFVLSLTPLDPAPNVGFMVVNAASLDAAREAIPRLRAHFRKALPDVEARVSLMFLGPSDPNVIQVQIKGPDADYIFEQSKALEDMLAAIPGTIDIWSDWFTRTTRFELNVDQPRARIAGVASDDVAAAVSGFVSERALTEFRDGDEVYPIVARATSDERASIDRLRSLAVFPPGSADPVPLSQVADVEPVSAFPRIQREDMTRTVTVEARNLLITPEDMAPMVARKLDALNATLAPGHVAEFDGIITDSADGRAALAANFPLAFGMIALLLVAQFNGYRRPLIIILTIPLLLIGALIGLKVMRADFGFLVILGLLSLAGIIVNNAIVLIDRIDIERRTGRKTDFEAVISASVRRLRPIIMTTVTTIVGLAPLIIGRDVLFFGMASVIAFGLAVGTVLTLGVAPVLYCMFFGVSPTAPAKAQGAA